MDQPVGGQLTTAQSQNFYRFKAAPGSAIGFENLAASSNTGVVIFDEQGERTSTPLTHDQSVTLYQYVATNETTHEYFLAVSPTTSSRKSIAALKPKQPIVLSVPHSYLPASGRRVKSRDA